MFRCRAVQTLLYVAPRYLPFPKRSNKTAKQFPSSISPKKFLELYKIAKKHLLRPSPRLFF